jgi:ADP-heptose:LPS heptosyltransferase
MTSVKRPAATRVNDSDPAFGQTRQRLQRVRSAIGRWVDLYVSTSALHRAPRHRGKIAITRVDGIGDFVLWLNGARAIRKRFPRPDYHLTLIASATWAKFAEASGLFDVVIEVDLARFSADGPYRRMIYRDIASRCFEIAINPTYSRSPWADDLLIRATGAPVTIGQAGDLSRAMRSLKRLTDCWYSELVRGDEATHELERNRHFARRFDPQAGFRLQTLEPGMISRPHWLPQDRNYFVLFPGASKPISRWPAERFGEITARIHARTGWTAIVCGAASDSRAAQQLMASVEDVPMVDACGQTTLAELAGVIADAKLVVTNDTSAVHLAAALGAPAVTILGGGHFGRFLPYPATGDAVSRNLCVACHTMPCYHCNWRCVHPRQRDEPGPCITSVTIEQVWAMVEPMLGSSHDPYERVTREVTHREAADDPSHRLQAMAASFDAIQK